LINIIVLKVAFNVLSLKVNLNLSWSFIYLKSFYDFFIIAKTIYHWKSRVYGSFEKRWINIK